jgi:ATP-dependent protease ClpP protease subunit
MSNIYRDGALWLYGYVGDNFWDEGFTATDVLLALAEHGRDNDLTVHINSGGGIVDEGVAIYNALANHKGQVRVEIDSIAASSASVIAMAGGTIVMKGGSLMMIHDPSNGSYGTAADHAKTIEQLEAYATQMAGIYAERSGKTPEEARADMKTEVWLTAAQAVEQGYADEAEATKAKAVSAFPYAQYAKAPKALKTKARQSGWTATQQPETAPDGASSNVLKEGSMSTQDTAPATAEHLAAIADAVKADRDRRKAIMALDEAKGREALASHFADSTTMEVEAVKAALAAAPKAAKEGVDLEAYDALRGDGQTNAATQGGGKPTGSKPVAIDRAKIFAARRTATA